MWVHVKELRPWGKNPRHNAEAVPAVVRSIREFGFPTAMVAMHGTGLLVAGHTRREAMLAILVVEPGFTLEGAPGPGFVPVRYQRFKSEAHAHAYALADNRLNEAATWDDDLLGEVARDIMEEGGVDDLGVAGFDDTELEAMLAEPDVEPDPDDDDAGPTRAASTPTRVQAGAGAPDSDVRMVQLFYPEERKAEFVRLCDLLGKALGTSNYSDTVLGALRAACAGAGV